jgi:Mg/Co/Ni transporter MgtE
VTAVKLIKADPSVRMADIVDPDPPHVHPDWDVGAIARKMSDFNLVVAPVMDEEHRKILGVVTIDDLLELLLPTGWRRDFGTTSAED